MTKKDIIESLSPREHVRLRPGMYIGDTSNANQLLLEIFSNALDMHNIGYGNEINVQTIGNNSVEVIDYGRGFPIDEIREDGLSTLVASFSIMNTSGKYADDGLYEGSSLGLNGIGGKAACFLSNYFKVHSWNNHKSETAEFEDGILVNRIVEDEDTGSSGTQVIFEPSSEFFTSPMIDKNYFKNFFDDIACLCPNLTIWFNNESYHHEDGIVHMVKKNTYNSISIVDSPMTINEEANDQRLSLGLTYTDESSPTIKGYVNYGLTESGPHLTAIKSVITRTLNSWAKENGLLSEKDKNLDGASLQEGLVLVFNLITKNVGYNAQVKNQISKIDASFANDIFAKKFEIWLDNNPKDAENIINKALLARKAAEAAKKAREAVKNKSNKKIKFAAMPSKLSDCHGSKNRKECELYVTEGDSASGGAKSVRNAKTQAIMGLKGKCLNCLTASPSQILKNAEIIDIIKALGFDYWIEGSEKNQKLIVDYNVKKMRYGKFIIAADKDSDGRR